MLITDLPAINSIKVGRFFLKPTEYKEYLARTVRLTLHEADDKSCPLWRSGSATLLRYKNRKFIAAARHSLNIEPGEALDIEKLNTVRFCSIGDDLGNIPVKSCIFEKSNKDQEFHDLLVFEVGDDWSNRTQDEPYFFQVRPFWRSSRITSIMIGYPVIDGAMDEYYDFHGSGQIGEINITCAMSDCELDEAFTSSADNYRHFRRKTSRRFPADGHSGGAVFSLVGGAGAWEVVLDGIVLRAGEDDAYIVDADFLIQVLDTA